MSDPRYSLFLHPRVTASSLRLHRLAQPVQSIKAWHGSLGSFLRGLSRHQPPVFTEWPQPHCCAELVEVCLILDRAWLEFAGGVGASPELRAVDLLLAGVDAHAVGEVGEIRAANLVVLVCVLHEREALGLEVGV